MKLILLLLIPLNLFAPPKDYAILKPESHFKVLFNACAYVESGHDDFAVNVKEMAFGRVQIRQIRLDDYYQRTGVRYSLEEMRDPEKSFEIFEYYAKLNKTTEKIVKKWNGSGVMADRYFEKVKMRL